jgi:hypothetical protein
MISTVVALKFIVLFGAIFWYTARQSRRLRAEVEAARAAEAVAVPVTPTPAP